LSEKFGLNVTGLRVLFVVFLFLGIGSPFIVYLILYLIKPTHY